MTSSEMAFRTAPANLTSLWGNPWGPISYGAPIPVGIGMGDLSSIFSGAGSGIATGAMIGGPVGAAVGAAVGILSTVTGLFHTSVTGMQKQDATTLVNGIEVFLKQNLAAFKANPTPANQAAALSAFNSLWGELVSGCSSFGSAGTACVNDRMPGGKWDWWAYYYNPIANYTFSAPAASTQTAVSGGASPAATNVASSSGGVVVAQPVADNSSLLLLGGAALVLFLMMRN